MAITKTQKKELSIIQNHIYEARLDLDAFREKFILDYMKEGLIDDCIHALEHMENEIDQEFQLLKEEARASFFISNILEACYSILILMFQC